MTIRQEVIKGRGGRKILGHGRAVTEARIERQDAAGPLPPGRGFCPSCWRDFALNWTGVVRKHETDGFPCRGGRALVFEGPLPAPAPEPVRPVLVHVAGFGQPARSVCGKAGSDQDIPWGARAPEGTRLCRNCLRKTS